jgi:hypothetical protein
MKIHPDKFAFPLIDETMSNIAPPMVAHGLTFEEMLFLAVVQGAASRLEDAKEVISYAKEVCQEFRGEGKPVEAGKPGATYRVEQHDRDGKSQGKKYQP